MRSFSYNKLLSTRSNTQLYFYAFPLLTQGHVQSKLCVIKITFMNTKIVLLILILNILPLSVSTGISSPKATNASEHSEVKNDASSIANEHNDKTIPWTIALQNNLSLKSNKPNSDDDGKTHHHHSERFATRRRKMIFYFLGKAILLVSYLCSLISFYAEL